ncbi:MAG: lipase maturation factor family protein [Opitutaceae bacterium]
MSKKKIQLPAYSERPKVSSRTRPTAIVAQVANLVGYNRWREFSGLKADATFLWPRWLVLRAVGFVYIFIFSGIIIYDQALLGPHGIVPLAEFFQQLRSQLPGTFEALSEAPSLFWLSNDPALITGLAWGGLTAAIALVLNLWPRLSLFACWLFFLSFASTWRVFSPAQLDNLMLEVALLCIPFAPAGLRPGLGEKSPPRPLALLMVRWLLFRVMFEAGIVKLAAGDPHWRDFTAMEIMYETSPFPTIFGYWDHQLSHFYHLFEIALTFAAELAAPLLAVWGGRNGRWFAFFTWTAFQAGIQLTSNFGWLNTASIGLGLLLLDDQMLAAAAARLRLSRLNKLFSAAFPMAPHTYPSSWRDYTLRGALWLHFAFTLVFLAKACGVKPATMPSFITEPVKLISGFRSANEFSLYASFDPIRYQVEFEGSNDGGRTWRSYEYRYLPQRPDDIAPFIAPHFARFDATLQIAVLNGRKTPLIPVVASHLLARNQLVINLFKRDPFPDRPPTIIRMRGYRLSFTSLAENQRTGSFWRKEFAGDYVPAIYLNDRGEIASFDLTHADEALRGGHPSEAIALLEQQFKIGNLEAGFRLAEILARGLGGRPQPSAALAILQDLERRGEPGATHNLGACYEFGIGSPIDYSRAAAAYRLAADRGYLLSLYSLGALHAQDKINPRKDIAGLSFLFEAISQARGSDPASRFVREDQAGHVNRLKARMSAEAIAEAEVQAGFTTPKRRKP